MRPSVRKTVLLVASAAALLLVVAAVFLRSPYFARYAFERAQAYLSSQYGVVISAARVSVDLSRGLVTMRGIEIRSLSAPDLPPLVQADDASINLAIWRTLTGPLSLQSSRIGRFAVNVAVAPDGRSNLPRSRQTRPSTGLPDFYIESLSIERGSFRFDDRRNGLVLELPAWDLRVAAGRSGTQNVTLHTRTRGAVRWPDASVGLDRLELAAAVERTSVRVDKFAVLVDESPIQASGSITGWTDPTLDLRIEAAADLARAADALHFDQEISGPVRTSAHVTGRLQSPVVSGQLLAGPLAAAGYEQVNVVSSYGWDGDSRRLAIRDLQVKSRQGAISAQGSLALDPGAQSSLEGRLDDWDLGPATEYLSSPARLASLASGTFSAHWPGLDFGQLSGRSELRLAASRSTPAADVLPVSGSGTILLNGKQVEARIRDASLLGSRVSGRLKVTGGRLAGSVLRANISGIGNLQSQLVSFLGRRDPFVPQQLDGSADIEAALGGTLKSPLATVKLASSNLRLGRLRDLRIDAEGVVSRERVEIGQAVLRAGEQTVQASGAFGLTGRDPALALDANLAHGSVPAVLASLESDVPAEGSFEARAHLSGTLRKPTGEVRFSASGLALYGEPLGNLVAEAGVTGSTIQTTRLQLQKVPGVPESGVVDGNASYDLSSGAFGFDLRGRSFQLQNARLPGGSPLQGTFALEATGSGTFARPVVDLRISAPDVRVQRAIGEVRLDGHLRGNEARVEASVPLLRATLQGHITTSDPYPARLELILDNSNLEMLDIRVANEETLGGSLDATLTAEGDLRNWAASRAVASVRTLKLVARNHELHNEGPLEARYANGTIAIERSRVVSGSSSLEISGTVPLQPDAPEGALSLKGAVQLGDVYPFVRTEEGFFINGVLNFDAALRGTPKKMQASGSFGMADGFLHVPWIRMPFTDIALDGRLQGGSVTLASAKAQYGSSQITLSGDLPLGLFPEAPFDFTRRQGPARFEVAVRNLTLESTGELPPGISGVIDIHARGELARPALDALTAAATIERLQFRVDEVPFEQSGTSVINVRGGSVDLGSITLSGPETRLQLGGSAELTGVRRLDLRLNGDIDAGIFSVLTRDLRATGNTHLEVALGGTMKDPQLGGTVQLSGGQANLRSLNLGADSLEARLTLSNNRITADNISGFINGGVLQGSGTVGYDRLNVTDVNLNARMEGVYLEIPEGLRTVVDADLSVRSTEYPITVSGRVNVQEGSYRKFIDLTGGLLSGFTAHVATSQAIDLGQPPNPLLSRIRYDVAVRAVNPIIVDNNVAKLAARANLRLVGTYYRPSVVGRANFEEGGEIRLNERSFVLERGSIQFLNETRLDPVLDLQAKTQVNPYDITIQVSGGPNNMKTTLTSDPPAPEPDLLSMLLTGRTQEEFRGEELAFAKEQALSLLAGTAGQRISGAAQKTLGFSTVRLEPSLISPEQDPGARLTVGQDLTEDFSLIYSMNLVNSNDQIWIAEYDVTRRFVTRGLMQEDNTLRFEFQHDVRFGGPAGTGRVTRADRTKREIGSLAFRGETGLTERQLQSKVKLKPGDTYDFFKVQSGRERLQEYFSDQDRLESRIVIKRDATNGKVNLGFALTPGPTVRFFFEGYAVPGKARDEVAKIWQDGIFDLQRADDAVQAIRRPLVEEGYLQSVVRYSIQRQGDSKEVRFTISPGARFSGVETVFNGNSEVSSSELQAQLRAADLETRNAVFNNPARVVEILKNHYRQQGFLQAEVEEPALELDPQLGSGQVIIAIKEGPRFTVGDLTIEGNTIPEERIRRAAALRPGDIFSPKSVQNALDRLDQLYHSLGYNDATVAYEPVLDSDTAVADITLRITERRQEVIKEIQIQGNHASSTRFVRRQLGISEGDVFDYDRIAAARKALYDTGAFTLVDLEPEPLEAQQGGAPSKIKPVKLKLSLREIRPYRLRYGGSYDTENGPGFTADLERRNLLGKAAVLGMRSRSDGQVKEFRSYYAQPFVGRFPLRTTVTGYAQREDRPGYLVDRFGASLMQQKRLKDDYLLDYGYRYERVRAPQGLPDELLRTTATVPVGKLLTSLTRDERDDMLDATRGSFMSHGLVYAPSFLGSKPDEKGNAAQYVKYFGQYFRYVPLGRRDESGKTRFVYAGALRIGLAKGLGGNAVITPERFFAGGGTTLRGFQQDLVGPVEQRGDQVVPLGGEAMFLLNNEIRVPLFSIFDGVAFVDVGNVYPRVRDFDPTDIRKSAGIGLRVRTGYIVLRLDYGMKLDRRTTPVRESRGAFFFSIGQAF